MAAKKAKAATETGRTSGKKMNKSNTPKSSALMTPVQEALTSWTNLNRVLRTLSEPELLAAIKAEKKATVPRKDVVLRLVRRYQRLRRDTERAELLS